MGYQISLAVSLHAADQQLRQKADAGRGALFFG